MLSTLDRYSGLMPSVREKGGQSLPLRPFPRVELYSRFFVSISFAVGF